MGTLWNLRPLAGVMLRYEVCLVLCDAGRPLPIDEIVFRVRRDGFELPERANKAVSDALRWDLRRKRVDRIRRGLYAAGRVPRSSEFRMRRAIAEARRELSLVPPNPRTGSVPPPNPEPIRNSLEHGTADQCPSPPATEPDNRNWLEHGTRREWSPFAQDVELLERAAERHFRAIEERAAERAAEN